MSHRISSREWTEQSAAERFEGETVVVTGAAGGIGAATASRIVREGGRGVAVDISGDRLDDFAATMPEAQIVLVAGGLTDQRTVEAVLDAAGDRIDCLANVAGITDDFLPLHGTTDEMWDRVLGTNLTGASELTRGVLPTMMAAGSGPIVNIASEAGLRGNAYTTSKYALIGLTKSAAFMYGPHGIDVNVVAPGGVATNVPMQANISQNGFGRRCPFHALIPTTASAAQLTASITFLLPDDGVNIDGAVLPPDRGWSVQ